MNLHMDEFLITDYGYNLLFLPAVYEHSKMLSPGYPIFVFPFCPSSYQPWKINKLKKTGVNTTITLLIVRISIYGRKTHRYV